MRIGVRSLVLLSGLRIWHCRGLWYRLTAVALIGPLAWEFPYAADLAPKRQKKKKEREREKKKEKKKKEERRPPKACWSLNIFKWHKLEFTLSPKQLVNQGCFLAFKAINTIILNPPKMRKQYKWLPTDTSYQVARRLHRVPTHFLSLSF